MKLYESTFILRQDLSVTEVKKVIEKLSAIIKDGKGKILKEEQWGLRPLAYEIKKNQKGHYVMLIFQAGSEVLAELDRVVKLTEEVIRNLLVQIEDFDGNDSIMLKKEETTYAKKDA